MIVVAVIVAALGGGYLARSFTPTGQPQQQADQQRRPIIQIVRQQPGLPSVADVVANLCPSIAAIVPAGTTGPAVPGFAVSPDGWVLAVNSGLPAGNIEVHFADGPAFAVTERHPDTISGLTLLKTDATGLRPIRLADQAFPRV